MVEGCGPHADVSRTPPRPPAGRHQPTGARAARPAPRHPNNRNHPPQPRHRPQGAPTRTAAPTPPPCRRTATTPPGRRMRRRGHEHARGTGTPHRPGSLNSPARPRYCPQGAPSDRRTCTPTSRGIETIPPSRSTARRATGRVRAAHQAHRRAPPPRDTPPTPPGRGTARRARRATAAPASHRPSNRNHPARPRHRPQGAPTGLRARTARPATGTPPPRGTETAPSGRGTDPGPPASRGTARSPRQPNRRTHRATAAPAPPPGR